MILLFILFSVSLFSFSAKGGGTVFDGKWQLDRVHSIGSADKMMQLMGLDSAKRKILNEMDIAEVYRITKTQFFKSQITYFKTINAVFPLGNETVENDFILGRVRQRVVYENQKLQETLIRESDHAVFIGVHKIQRDDMNKIIYSMNFTLPDGRKATCTRYFLKRAD